MSYSYGDTSRKGDVGMVGTLMAVGTVASTAAQHVLLLLGTSTRGPSKLVGLVSASSALAYYHSGDLKNSIEDSFGEGAPLVCTKRIVSSTSDIASATIGDGLETEAIVADVVAKGPGAYGNQVVLNHYKNSLTHVEHDTFVGDGSIGPYALANHHFTHKTVSDTNWIEVGGVRKTLVYEEDNLGTNKVFLDETNGTLLFYTGEGPTTHVNVEYYLEFFGMDVQITDNEKEEWRTNIRDLDGYIAGLNTSSLVTAVARTGQTHLPEFGTTTVPVAVGLTGGDDGDELTTDDVQQSLYEAGAEILAMGYVPTCTAITCYEIVANSYDVYSIVSGWTMTMNVKWAPTIAFVATRPNETVDNVSELAKRFENRHLAIVYPAWDESDPRKNLAVCCAAREAACNLGESCAKTENRLKTAYGLLGDLNDTIDSDYVVTLNKRGIYVLEKTDAGVGPHMGVTTDTTDQFKRTVDQRTANAIIVDTNNTMAKYFFYQNTKETRNYMDKSLIGFLSTYKSKSRIYDYETSVLPDSVDPNMVYIEIKFIPVGHVEWMDTTFMMGVYKDLVELQES